jgi:hypothetical protein
MHTGLSALMEGRPQVRQIDLVTPMGICLQRGKV